ncbi:xylulokinase [Mediterraneibacter gnavus]|uniref:xylulokinase n=1 Tax=Mediterraneibacter gnavus TaxID=33038 RepID=UPI00232E2942|nr:FGGY family carbohydrate kinase [Mediterraneibacter gnavus]MDB8710053.1 FGGY family carbohydrate kinase [Mediterraneibacter gnavus]MDB8713478.1 FGGY family carbohydrate kinase [Mediterraneibacter gnavus]
MKKNKLIAYDLGTGGIKASLFDSDGNSLAEVFQQYKTYFPKEKFSEQRPEDWWNGVCQATRLLLGKSGCHAEEIACTALSGHSLVAVPIDRDGHVLLAQVPIWSDMRAEDQIPNFFENLSYEDWYLTTGNGDPAECYTVLKLMWMREHQPDIFARTYKILGSKDFINFKFTGTICTDPSYASGFGVFNLLSWDYEQRFLEASGVSIDIFPKIRPSDSIIGYVTKSASEECGLCEGTPVACGAVDNTCMALGARGLEEGVAYTSLGSSSWIAVTSQTPIVDLKTRPFVFAHAKKGYYTSAVSIFSAGNSFRWVRDQILKDYPDDTNTYDIMNQMAESTPPGAHGVLFNPSLAGGSAQEPSPNLNGGFMGLTLSNTREDLVRASMEGVAMALRRTLDILLKQTAISGDMLLCGGCSKSSIWRRIFADIYNMPVIKTNIDQDAASLGAASLAANACGLWNGYNMIGPMSRKSTN